MTSYRVTYMGPTSFAVRVATLLADAEGIELTSAERQEDADEAAQTAVLVLTVRGTTDAVTAAIAAIRDGLPAEATVTVED